MMNPVGEALPQPMAEVDLDEVKLDAIFDAEVDAPYLVDQIAISVPQIREVLARLRAGLPLAPNAGVGRVGNSGFFRLPNHYRSISYILPDAAGKPRGKPGVVVFKGTEPLMADFPSYLDWMMDVPFRAAPLSMGLHFPLEMKLPPGAMWIEECKAEQQVASELQRRYLDRYGRLARLPVPLFVFKMTHEQNLRYHDVVAAKIPRDAYTKIKNKLADGLGVEVYFYPELPVRVADLSVGNVRETFKSALQVEEVRKICEKWAQLFSEMLGLGVMPYSPWHHGMGACVDAGNACVDGGFNDLLTLVSFEAIPTEKLFRASVTSSIKLLAESMVSLVAASLRMSSVPEPDSVVIAAEYLRREIHDRVCAIVRGGYVVDDRVLRCFERPSVDGIFDALRIADGRRGRPNQYLVPESAVAVRQTMDASGRTQVKAWLGEEVSRDELASFGQTSG